MFVGSKHPNWKLLVPQIEAELSTGLQIEAGDRVYKVLFKVRLLISDLEAKSHLLNMLKFNGFYGCHFCTAKGKTIGRTHSYYPYGEQGSLRESALHDVYVSVAENLGTKKKPNVVGVKGKSAFAGLIRGLPMTAPIDYMHCVLLGVFPDVLKLCYKNLTTDVKEIVNEIVANCPREMISYSRKIRSLDELSQFKATSIGYFISVLLFFSIELQLIFMCIWLNWFLQYAFYLNQAPIQTS